MSYRGNSPDADPGQDERDEQIRERNRRAWLHRDFLDHPNPRDPDYPGEDE